MANPQQQAQAATSPNSSTAPTGQPAAAVTPPAISPDTLKAFTSAPPDRQRAALARMSIPAKQALLAAIKASRGGSQQTGPAQGSQPTPPAGSQPSLITTNQFDQLEKTAPEEPGWRDRVIGFLTRPDPAVTPQEGSSAADNAARISGNLAAGAATGATQANAPRRGLGGVAP